MLLLIGMALKKVLSVIYLNTSHVTVNLFCSEKLGTMFHDLNTSHVTVNPIPIVGNKSIKPYLNTSHVTVNQMLHFAHYKFCSI